jgi:hypothetical protein
MTFLQPWVLVALPLVSLPLIIHLINQRRFQTVHWGAMMFLLSARALSRGYSRLRHWLIMLMRMLAVAAVILAVGRPLSRGWLALAGGGRPDTAIVILDRSPSMQARDRDAADTKLDTGRRQLAEAVATLGAAHTIVFTDPTQPPIELDDPRALADLPTAGPAAAPADIPRLLQGAYDHIRASAAGASEVWICSDQRGNDWAVEAGGWSSLREAFAALPQPVRFQLLAFPQPAAGNLAVRVTATRLERRAAARDLLLSIVVSREDEGQSPGEPVTVPVTIELGGATSTVELAVTGREAVLANHAIPLGPEAEPQGHGRVTIPADANAADNEFYFVFAEPAPRRTLVVADDEGVGDDAGAARGLALVAGIPPDKSAAAEADLVPSAAVATAAWEEAALVLWQAPLPEGDAAAILDAFVNRGGQVVFFPPAEPDGREFAGCRWTEWTSYPEPLAPETWRTNEDLLANTRAGAALPVGELAVTRSCGLTGEIVPLASLPGGTPLVARVATRQGGIFFCTTTPAAQDSSLASEGIVLYALVQRAIDRGLESLSPARQLDAGAAATVLGARESSWTRIAGAATAPVDEIGMQPAVYAREGRLVAVNRPVAEDTARILPADRIDGLFQGLPFARQDGRAGGTDSLVQEIWRAFLIAMVLALIGEGLLCMPSRMTARATPDASPFGAAA